MSEETKDNAVEASAERTSSERSERPERGDRAERGDRGGDRPERGGDRGPRRGGGRFQRRRKFCKFCADTSLKIDHKDPEMLRHFITDRFKILPARVTGNCSAHQRQITSAIKRARVLALLSFTPLHHD